MVEFTNKGIRIGGKETGLYSGSIHYWRHAKKDWEKILDSAAGMGFQILETYIPWSVHEVEEGVYDFGSIDESKDLEGFLQLCERKGKYLIVRPGPHINAELSLFGYPRFLLEEEGVQAKGPDQKAVIYPFVTGTFPIPSYASERLYEKTEVYFARLQPVLQRHCYPKGCIIAIQADNETCYFFRDKAYVMDYCEDSVRLYQNMLEEEYGDIRALSRAYGKSFQSFKDVMPPRGYDEKEIHIAWFEDWVKYKEYQILYALKRMTDILLDMKLPIPIFHNCAYQTETPVSVQRIEAIPGLSVAGIDAYPEKNDTKMLKQRIRYMAGSSRLVFVPEFGSGSWFDRGTLLTEKQEAFSYLYALMNGMKAVNFYMLAERDRWTGCPIRADGIIRKNFHEMFRQLLCFLQEEEVHSYFRKPGILILKSYEIGRLEALLSTTDLNSFSSNLFVKGPVIPPKLFEAGAGRLRALVEREKERLSKTMEILDRLKLDYDLSDDYVTNQKLYDYHTVIVSDEDGNAQGLCWKKTEQLQKRLKSWQAMGKRRVIFGTEHLNQLKNLMEKEGKAVAFTCDSNEIELAVHEHEEKKQQLVYLANVSDQEVKTTVKAAKQSKFTALQYENKVTTGKELELWIPAHTVTVYKVEDDTYDS